ncbi:MAG: hypothetical protein HC800_15020 [Phormidesmis sp. RL_2_1]|nr:hypothetical protein [Phormidesmis sp. RL_2_1]
MTMLLRDNPYFAILCLTAVISGCVAFTAWLRRAEAPATQPFTGLMVAIEPMPGLPPLAQRQHRCRALFFGSL